MFRNLRVGNTCTTGAHVSNTIDVEMSRRQTDWNGSALRVWMRLLAVVPEYRRRISRCLSDVRLALKMLMSVFESRSSKSTQIAMACARILRGMGLSGKFYGYPISS